MPKGKATSKPTQSQILMAEIKKAIMLGFIFEGGAEAARETCQKVDDLAIAVSGDAYRQGVADGKRNRDKKIEVIDHSDWS